MSSRANRNRNFDLSGYKTATNNTKSAGKFNFEQEVGKDENQPHFVIKKDSMPSDIFQAPKSDIHRESLHRLPARKEEYKARMSK